MIKNYEKCGGKRVKIPHNLLATFENKSGQNGQKVANLARKKHRLFVFCGGNLKIWSEKSAILWGKNAFLATFGQKSGQPETVGRVRFGHFLQFYWPLLKTKVGRRYPLGE